MGRGEVNFVARLQDALSPPSPVSQLVLLLFFLLERGLGQAASRLLPRKLLRLHYANA